MRQFLLLLGIFLGLLTAEAAKVDPEQLKALQAKIDELERGLSSAKQAGENIGSEIGRLNKLLKLQSLEIRVSQSELQETDTKLQETEARVSGLKEIINVRKEKLRIHLSQLPAMQFKNPLSQMDRTEKTMSSMHRGLIDKIVKHERDEILQLKKMQDELEGLEDKLKEEKLHRLAHVEDLKEKQSVLTLNQEINSRRLEKNKQLQAERLKEFQETKTSEHEVDAMISSINSGAQMSGEVDTIRTEIKKNRVVTFLDRKGELALPAEGAVIHQFGKKYDPRTNLYTFHKGIEIATKANANVRSIFPGKVVFAGKLGGYRQLLILDHGKQFYSLVGHLGETLKKVGDIVKEGEVIGKSSPDNTPLYFEIRQRHIAVNPVSWFRDLKLLAKNQAN